MWFWIKNGLITLILLAAALFLLLGEDFKFTGTPSKEKPNQAAQPVRQAIEPSTGQLKNEKQPDEKKEAFSMSSSGAAKGLSNFYGKVRAELLGNSKTMGDGFVISVEPSIYTLDEQLQRRGEMVNPGSPKFTGERISRRFRIGETIREQLAAAAEVEGIALIWQLDRDYIIKHYFEVDSDLISALGTVASALDSDFEKDVFAFYCYKQRAVIIAHEKSDFVNSNCRLATTKP